MHVGADRQVQASERKVSRVNRDIEMRIGTNISLAVSNRTVADSHQHNFRRYGFTYARVIILRHRHVRAVGAFEQMTRVGSINPKIERLVIPRLHMDMPRGSSQHVLPAHERDGFRPVKGEVTLYGVCHRSINCQAEAGGGKDVGARTLARTLDGHAFVRFSVRLPIVHQGRPVVDGGMVRLEWFQQPGLDRRGAIQLVRAALDVRLVRILVGVGITVFTIELFGPHLRSVKQHR